MAAATTAFTFTKLLSSAPKALSPLLSSKTTLSSYSSSSSAISHLLAKLHYHKPHLRFSATPTKISATISVGNMLPEATLSFLDSSNGLKTVSISDLTANKKAVLFAFPGAFTPTCYQKHLPGSVEKAAEFKSKGVDIDESVFVQIYMLEYCPIIDNSYLYTVSLDSGNLQVRVTVIDMLSLCSNGVRHSNLIVNTPNVDDQLMKGQGAEVITEVELKT